MCNHVKEKFLERQGFTVFSNLNQTMVIIALFLLLFARA